jgi:hypothetical protein
MGDFNKKCAGWEVKREVNLNTANLENFADTLFLT